MWSLLGATPSIALARVDVGGSTAGTQTNYFAYGYFGQNRPLIEGINTTEGTSAAGFYLDYGSFEEVFIGAAGNSAEMPNPGVLTQFVGRSGGARLSANLYYDYENDDIQSRNLPAEATIPSPGATIRPDGNRLASYKNLNLSVGGPILPERLWGYFAYLNQQNSTAAPPSGSILDGTPFNTKLFNYTGKATYQLNQKNKFVGYIQHGTKQQPNRTDSSNRLGAPVHILGDSTVLQDSPSWVFKGEWNGTLTQNLFAEFRAGQFGYNFGLDSNTGDIRYESLTTNEILGGGREWLLKRRRNQFTGAVSYFKDNFAGRLAPVQGRRRVPGRDGRDDLESDLYRQRHPLRQRLAPERGVVNDPGAGSPGQQRRQPERARDDERLRHRHLAHQQAHHEPWGTVRSVSRLAAGAGAAGGAVRPRTDYVRGGQRGRRLQSSRAQTWRELRPRSATARRSSKATGDGSSSTPV